jgi:penicillin-binding protein 1A
MARTDRTRRGRRALGWALRLVGLGVLFAIGAWFGLVASAYPRLDDLERRAEQRFEPGVILAADGRTILRRLRAPETRTYLDPQDVPPLLADAVVAAEDRRFRSHSGIDLRGIARAARADIEHRAVVEGGSTITQQLVKNTYVGPDRSLARKSREAILAVALETRWTKDRILAAYLNSAYFGGGRYGAADAARGYFGAPVAELRVDQAALLAALLRAPEGINPAVDPAAARAARDGVLETMRELGMIDAAQLRAALERPIPRPRAREGSTARELAPHLADRVSGDLIERYGVARALGGGLRVRTTIDAELQRHANDAVRRAGDVGLAAALVAIDPTSGELRAAALGGQAARGAFDVAFDGQRQPGSAFKPFMLAAAYEQGYAPGTVLESAPFDKAYPGGRFRVTNDGGYAGAVTLERATWRSDNTVYARLQDRLGIETAIEQARAAGIRSRMDPVPALVLGALPQGTTPVELAHAYATFAAHGTRTSMVGTGGPRYVAWVSEPGSGERWRPPAIRRGVMPREVADLVTSTLRGVVRDGTGTAAAIGRPAAGKTGTTEQYRDAWFVGYTPELVTAVWVGHVRGGVPMRTENGGGPVTGGSIPARIWQRFMSSALEGEPVREFDLREPRYVTVSIDAASGLLAGPWCAGSIRARYIAGREPTETTDSCIERDRPLPDLVGLRLEDARALLTDQAFEVRPAVEERLVARVEQAGVVIEQQPPAGTRLFRDEPITLVVGDHPFAD